MNKMRYIARMSFLLLLIMAAGCGKSNSNAGEGGFSGQGVTPPGQPERTADVIAKVKSIDNGTLVVYTSDADPAMMSGMGGRRGNFDGGAGGTRPKSGPDGGKLPEGRANGAAPQGDVSGTAAAGDANGGQGGRQGGLGRGMNAMEFKTETTSLSVDDQTQVVMMMRGEQGMEFQTTTWDALQPDDVVLLWLDDKKEKAEYIQLMQLNR